MDINKIKRLSELCGQGTSLVTIIIPSDGNL